MFKLTTFFGRAAEDVGEKAAAPATRAPAHYTFSWAPGIDTVESDRHPLSGSYRIRLKFSEPVSQEDQGEK